MGTGSRQCVAVELWVNAELRPWQNRLPLRRLSGFATAVLPRPHHVSTGLLDPASVWLY